jgi:hypothetical protein
MTVTIHALQGQDLTDFLTLRANARSAQKDDVLDRAIGAAISEVLNMPKFAATSLKGDIAAKIKAKILNNNQLRKKIVGP